MIVLNKPITLEMNWDDLSAHRLCFVGDHPLVVTYLSDFNSEWEEFLKHMISLLKNGDIKGAEYLNLSKYKKNLVTKSQNFIVIKSNEDKLWVIFCCLLPNLSIRLVITENAETVVKADDEYADKVVGYLNTQFQACWTVTAQLMNSTSLDHIFVRRFKNYTARLLLSGCTKDSLDNFHKVPMKSELKMLKRCNFDDNQYDQLRNEFPKVSVLELLKNDQSMKCSCKRN